MKKTYILLLLALSLAACKEKINYVLKVDLKQLSEEDIYTFDKVEEVIFDATERNPDSLMDQSRREFLKGADLLKNKNKPAMAVTHLKKSILTFPQAKTYYELGDALYQIGGSLYLEESLKSYGVAEKLGFEPAYRVYFHKAKVYAALQEAEGDNSHDYSIHENLRLAFSNGYVDTAELQSLSPFQRVLHTDRYQYLVQNYLGNTEGGSDAVFNVFSKQFGAAKKEFAIDTAEVGMNENNTNISFDFRKYVPEMQNVSFGRDVSHEFFYVAAVSENPNYVALIYSSVAYWEVMSPVYTTLATFDRNGNRISTLVFACSCTPARIKTGRISGNTITLENLDRTWLHAIDKVPFSENAVTSTVSSGKAVYRIEEDGSIVAVDVPDTFGDTLKYAKSEGGKDAN